MEQTKLAVFNNTKDKVKVYLTLGATEGCIQNVGDIPFITNVLNDLQGWFDLLPNQTVEYTSPNGVGLNGNFSFNTPPLNCPTSDFPSGINLAEFIINNSFQSGTPQETLDISGVAGTNAYIEFSMSGGGAWNANAENPNITKFSNSHIGNNKGRIGVYPYACTNCTSSVNPPSCSSLPVGAPNPITPQDSPICNVQRDASTMGGTVTITYNGDASAQPE